MPTRNLNTIVIALCISVLCYVTQRRAETGMIVGEALDLIDAYYVDPVDKDALLTAAMKGMTSSLDPHSEYVRHEDFETFQDNINQEFAGIGIFVEPPAEQGDPVRVVTPLVGSPALRAGMLPGDRIVRVNDEDVSSLGLREVSQRLKGPAGTVVNITVKRGEDDAEEELLLTVQRATIELESVIGDYRDKDDRWVYRLREDPSIAYVRLTGFGEKTVDELRRVLTRLNNDFAAIVLDLRGNGGGLLHTAVEVSDMFLDSGDIVSTRIRGGKTEDSFSADSKTLVALDKPMAILINGNSASASEIVAACLQDNHRAVIVGSRSYGKGTVQNVLPLEYGRSALRLTVARYYRPSGENIHRGQDASDEDTWGVRPDEGLEVELDEDQVKRLLQRWREASYPSLADARLQQEDSDRENPEDAQSDSEGVNASESEQGDSQPTTALQADPQLRRAVEYLREQIKAEQPRLPTAA